MAALALPALFLASPANASPVSVVDDAGRTVRLAEPARRIVSLAPHATEMLFAAGAGARVVGASEYSDYPPEATRIPSIGSGVTLDLERIVQLKPDLIVGWDNGNAATQLRKLDALGIPVFRSAPQDFATIASSLERIGRLAGTDAAGQEAANRFRARLAQLRTTYQDRRSIKVFYQIWRSPLMTLNGQHLVSAALRLCGGENVFAALPQIAPTVSVEAVVKANPEAIFFSSGAKDDSLAIWRRFKGMAAVRKDNLFEIDGTLMNRVGPRVLDGTEAMCEHLDAARRKH